ncbi:MAG TPA: hypothetical protein VMU18_05455 [Rhodoblastus sp.]|nr:hypothetical protein [Rhodoblastus sp.]
MSRKSIQINVPAPVAPKPPAKASARQKAAPAEGVVDGVVDSWVTQEVEAVERLAEQAFAPSPLPSDGLTIEVRLTSQPSWAEVAKIFVVLPQAALWFWWLGAAQKAMRVPSFPQLWRR